MKSSRHAIAALACLALAGLSAAASPSPATAAGKQAFVPLWTTTKRIWMTTAPTFFAYRDKFGEDGPERDSAGERRFAEWRALRIKNGWYCNQMARMTDGLASVVFLRSSGRGVT